MPIIFIYNVPSPLLDTFVKPSLWLLVNPNIACPIQYVQNKVEQQAECAHVNQLEPGEMQGPSTADLRICPHQEEALLSVSSSAEYKVTLPIVIL